jgi:hypothetical protein
VAYLRLCCEKNVRILQEAGWLREEEELEEKKAVLEARLREEGRSGSTRYEPARLTKSGRFLSKRGEIVGGWSRKRIIRSIGRGGWKISWQQATKKVRSKISPDEKRAWTLTEPTGQQSTIS